jgi:two-component system, sensor histidine kinase RpfC
MAAYKILPGTAGVYLRDRFRSFLHAVGWIGTPEQEQAALRVVIPLSFLAYLFLRDKSSAYGTYSVNSGFYFIITFLFFALSLLVSTLVWNTPSHKIRIIGILGDTCALSLGLGITGATGAPWFGVYLWVTLGNGFRYGEKYLYLSTAISLFGFGCVAYITPFWVEHRELAIGLAFTLLLIPAYSAILIRRLNEARQRADAASRAKSDFLSCMSHEIRTPLNGILGMTDLLRLRPLPTEDKECIETIHVSGHALARQINEILDLSKIEAGRMTVETVDFDLYVLVNTTLRIFQIQAQEKGLRLHSDIDPATPYLLSGDPHKIRQIITNLVGNAMKFTSHGSITLHILPVLITENNTSIRFEVADTGTGIPQDKLQAIFDPFTQASDSIARNYGGTGLGTTICKNLVELMGGSIGIESTLNVGTTFWFELPFAMNTVQSESSLKDWTNQCRVAYLSPAIQKDDAILNKLEEWGIPYEAYTSVEDVFPGTATSNKYDALLIRNMPASSLLDSILDGTGKDLPEKTQIVLVNNKEHSQESPATRPSLFILDTPLQENLLLNVLHACYSRHGTEDEIVHFAHKQSRVHRLDRKLNILVSDDNATNRIVMQRMLDKLGHQHTIVNGGEAALLALENEKFDAVIIDKNMPDMGGVEVFQAYCFAHGGEPPVEFAILTADATEEARSSCEAAGIRHFLTKPVSLVRLTETLSDMCGSLPEASTPVETSPVETTGQPLSVEIFNEAEFDKLAELAGSDYSFVRDLIENFVDDTNKNIRGMESAVAKGDWPAFRDLAHALKGSSLYLGLNQLAELARNAQDGSLQEFKDEGVNQVVAIRKAADSANALIQNKLADHPERKTASQNVVSGSF